MRCGARGIGMNIVDSIGGSPQSAVLASAETDRDAFHRVAHALGATWRLAALVFAVALAAMVGMLFLMYGTIPHTTTYHTRIQFTFPGASVGRYPNGDLFSVTEIIDPAVLT